MLMKTSKCAANNGTSAEEWLFRNNALLALVAQLSEFWYNFARMKMYASEAVINNDAFSLLVQRSWLAPTTLKI